jgi:competence protein ComEC
MNNGSPHKLSKIQNSVLVVFVVLNIFLLLYQSFLSEVNSVTTVSFLDVGQGDAIFIQSPNGNTVLIDAGPDDSTVRVLSEIVPFWQRTIGMIVPTHPDKDHIGGFPEVLRRFDVEVVYDSPFTATTSIYNEYVKERDREDALILNASFEDVIVLDKKRGVYMRIFFPDNTTDDLSRNESSTIVQLVHEDIAFLLTGDAGVMMEDYLVYLYGEELESDVLKVGHHGSKTSTSKLFLETVKPKYAVISAGENNRYGHPHQEVVDRLLSYGITIFETKHSTFSFQTNGTKVWHKK